MGRALTRMALGLSLAAAGIVLLRWNFWLGMAAVLLGILLLTWFQSEFFKELLLWAQGIAAKGKSASRGGRATSADSPFVIANPTIGFLNLAGDSGWTLAQQDRAALARGFSAASDIETTKVPRCNVLFLYGALAPSGEMAGQPIALHELVRAAGAHIAVLASDVPQDVLRHADFNRYVQAGHDWPANIVLTLNRNGESFGRFFKSLFAQMREGATMPMAWVRLAPQGPVAQADGPGTVALMEAGHIAFAKA